MQETFIILTVVVIIFLSLIVVALIWDIIFRHILNGPSILKMLQINSSNSTNVPKKSNTDIDDPEYFELDSRHITNLKHLDTILLNILSTGNSARLVDIFPTKSKGVTETIEIFFPGRGHVFLEALDYLEKKGLIYKISNSNLQNHDTYHLTYEGYLKCFGNKLEQEYRNSINEKNMNVLMIKSNLDRNRKSNKLQYLAITISIIAILVSSFIAVLKMK
ncbi:MAG TPA: hypothetical protein PKM27_16020 [Saprospiraceae bacterium]|nr:hypothetical protein [Saprospiraceae bacterium]HNT19901.1 hypothetical protein [Saprospiraceae bacterium]